MISPKSMSIEPPRETTLENPIRFGAAQSSIAAHTAPDCDARPSEPARAVPCAKVAFSPSSGRRMPRQLGPTTRTPCRRALLDNARRHGVRVVGPNCLGILRPELGLNATFAHGTALAGSLGLASQSGAVCAAMLDWAAPNRIGFSSVVSLGASTDIDFGEIIDYLANDPKTEHILLYIEGIRDARRFLSGLRAAARVKPVIVMKVGRHPAGSRAAVSHTGAIVGTDDVFDAAVRRAGVVRVSSIGQLVAAAQALAARVRPQGDRLAV